MNAIGRKLPFLTLACSLAIFQYAGANAAGTGKLEIIPDHIRVGAFYHGSKVRVTAEIPVCDEAVIKIEGKEEELTLNKKGKMGIVWLNVAKIRVTNAPQVYILASSDELSGICTEEQSKVLGLGLEALKKRIKFYEGTSSSDNEFDEFLKLKEHSGAYNVDNKIKLARVGEDWMELSTILPIPAAIPPGEYNVQLYCFKNCKLAGDLSTKLSIERTGLPLMMIKLAYKHAAAYGIMAIVMAMAAGIIMGLIFSLRGLGH